MIQIKHEQKPYYYENIGEGQKYGVNCTMTLEDDITTDEAIQAFVDMLRFAGYTINKDKLKEIVENIE